MCVFSREPSGEGGWCVCVCVRVLTGTIRRRRVVCVCLGTKEAAACAAPSVEKGSNRQRCCHGSLYVSVCLGHGTPPIAGETLSGVSLRMFPEEVRAGIGGLSKADGAPNEGGSTRPERPEESAVEAGSAHSPPDRRAGHGSPSPHGALTLQAWTAPLPLAFLGPPSAQSRSGGFLSFQDHKSQLLIINILKLLLSTHSSILAWRISWTEATVHGVTGSNVTK